jgi:tetratricopeptide (TPR) repeat protein
MQKSSQYKYSKPAHIPSYAQINEWKQKGEWNNILQYADPYDYFPKILPKARELLCQIADSLGSHADSKSIDALIVLLNFGYYWDVSFAAMTSLSKIGDEKVLAVLEKFEARTIGGRAILDESISYLKKRISYKTFSSNAVTPQDLLDQSTKAFFKYKNYQEARILLESLLPQIDKSDSKYLDVVILLARSCAETRDYGRALELIKSIFPILPEKYQKPLSQEMASWFWSDLGFREYSPASDNDYCFALQADIEAVLAEDDAGEALYKLKSLTRNLEQLGAGSSIELIRTLIRTEAQGSQYVDHDRGNYIRKTNLSPVMKDFLAKFDEVIKTSITEKIQKMLEGIELSDDFVIGTITIEIDDDDFDDDSDDEEDGDSEFLLESD